MNKTRRMVLIALFAAFLGIGSQLSLSLPLGVPLTLQTFVVALCGRVLGRLSGTVSVLIWLSLGAAGFPLFSAFRGGISVLLGPTGGFLIGFLCLVPFCGNRAQTLWKQILIGSAGLILCHLLGILWFCFVTKQSVFAASLAVSLPYFPKDVLCLLGANICAKGMGRILPLS